MVKNKVAIEVKNVTMKFNLMEEQIDNLKEYVVKLLKGRLLYNEFIALEDVSLTVNKGEVVGLIGFNGAGKSTLLKIIAGVLRQTDGTVKVNGSIAPLIEVGAGFDPELTARENVYLNGAILGHSKEFLDKHFQNIIDFAELQQFVDVPVKNFSSGMYARLGFAIATEVKPDVLIIDEVLSVGDYQFQGKCENRINGMIKQGTTVIIVSHSMDIIKKICTKLVWLDHGRVKMVGKVKNVAGEFENFYN